MLVCISCLLSHMFTFSILFTLQKSDLDKRPAGQLFSYGDEASPPSAPAEEGPQCGAEAVGHVQGVTAKGAPLGEPLWILSPISS